MSIYEWGGLLFVWVDDIVIMGPGRDKLIQMMKEEFKIKDLGRAQHVLGMKISYNENGSIRVDQEHYVKGLLKKYDMENSNSFGTPMQSNLKLVKSSDEEI